MAGGLDIAVTVSCHVWSEAVPECETLCRDAASAAFATAARIRDAAEVSLMLADDELVRTLNRDYRGHDGATNVLAFAAMEGDGPRPPGAPVMLGDVVIAYETAADEAATGGRALADHLRHLVVHGMLHLLGFDHRSDDQAVDMEELEIRVLSGLGVADPYAEPAPGKEE